MEVAPERRERLVPVRAVAHRAAEAGLAFHHVERAGDALGGGERGGDAGFRGVPGVQRLRHRVHAERLLQPGGEGGDGRERVREALAVELEQLGGGRGGAEAADGAGVVPVLVVRAAHRRADAGRDLVADDHRAQERFAARAARLGERERGGNGRRAGVIDAVAEDVVDLDRVRGRAVDQRRGADGRPAAEREAGRAAIELVGERALEQRRGRHDRAGEERGVPVDHRALGVMQHVRRYGSAAGRCGERGEPLDDVHQSTFAPEALTSLAHFAVSARM